MRVYILNRVRKKSAAIEHNHIIGVYSSKKKAMAELRERVFEDETGLIKKNGILYESDMGTISNDDGDGRVAYLLEEHEVE